ncbi:hypothetical protein MMC22_011686 [Lobaria immixta]|nr:hypothetical protein [Lobaria immixta]
MASDRRPKIFSGKSSQSAASSLIRSAAIAESYLESEIKELDLNDSQKSARETLQRWLSIKSVISTSSSNAIQQQEAVLDTGKMVFRSIGKGFCAEVFDQVGRGSVLKRAFNPQNHELWNDYTHHVEIYLAVTKAIGQKLNLDVHVPRVFNYYARDSQDWWEQNRHKWLSATLREPTDLLETEMILPLPRIIRVRRENRNFQPEFSLRNFEADLNILDELHLEKAHHAQAMAICLAEMHWDVKIDAADVEFVLGTAPEKWAPKPAELAKLAPRTDTASSLNFRRRSVHLWLLDFNQCKSIRMDDAGVNQAVAAFWQNDPYYPRPCPPGHPDAELWEIFEARYIHHSDKKLDSKAQGRNLARQFIDGVVAEAKRLWLRQRDEQASQPVLRETSHPGASLLVVEHLLAEFALVLLLAVGFPKEDLLAAGFNQEDLL